VQVGKMKYLHAVRCLRLQTHHPELEHTECGQGCWVGNPSLCGWVPRVGLCCRAQFRGWGDAPKGHIGELDVVRPELPTPGTRCLALPHHGGPPSARPRANSPRADSPRCKQLPASATVRLFIHCCRIPAAMNRQTPELPLTGPPPAARLRNRARRSPVPPARRRRWRGCGRRT
jgi:hypothetical protein